MFAAGVPCFGSCWGLQVGVTAAGGSVVRNPRGREFGFGRRITLTSQGRDHAMFPGKPEVFEAATVHVDTVEALPAGATALAHNDMGLQAAEIKLKKGTFWGVQYHPEYSCAEIAAMARRYADVLIRDGLVKRPGGTRCAGRGPRRVATKTRMTRASRGASASARRSPIPASSLRSFATGSTGKC